MLFLHFLFVGVAVHSDPQLNCCKIIYMQNIMADTWSATTVNIYNKSFTDSLIILFTSASIILNLTSISKYSFIFGSAFSTLYIS